MLGYGSHGPVPGLRKLKIARSPIARIAAIRIAADLLWPFLINDGTGIRTAIQTGVSSTISIPIRSIFR
jgi:hypothetical protein